MNWPVLLAHGALGYWDELIFVSIAAIFIVMMGVSWVRSRGIEDTPEMGTLPPDPKAPSAKTRAKDEHFELD